MGVEVLLTGLSKLRNVKFGSDRIPNRVARCLKKNGGCLKTLDLRNCRNVNGYGVGNLMELLPSMQYLEYSSEDAVVVEERSIPKRHQKVLFNYCSKEWTR